jgi:hypothetical protein
MLVEDESVSEQCTVRARAKNLSNGLLDVVSAISSTCELASVSEFTARSHSRKLNDVNLLFSSPSCEDPLPHVPEMQPVVIAELALPSRTLGWKAQKVSSRPVLGTFALAF